MGRGVPPHLRSNGAPEQLTPIEAMAMNSRSTCACRARARESCADFGVGVAEAEHPVTLRPTPQTVSTLRARLRVVRPGHVSGQRNGLLGPDDDRLIQPGPYEKVEVENLNLPLKARNAHESHGAVSCLVVCRQIRPPIPPLKTTPVFQVLGLNSGSR